MSNKPLRILVVEDSDADYELLTLKLAQSGVVAESRRVENASEMRAALGAGAWDLVISDYNLPRFSPQEALDLLRDLDPDTPLILMSGAVGEEAAVEALVEGGADDFVVKDNLARLVPAIERSVSAAEVRRSRRRAEAALRESEARLRALASNIPGMVFQLLRMPGGASWLAYVGPGSVRLFGLAPESLTAAPEALNQLIHPAERESLEFALADAAHPGAELRWAGRAAPGGAVEWIEIAATARSVPGNGVVFDGLVTDITAHKAAQASMRDSRTRLRELAAHLESAKEEERGRVAREIHDEIGAIFFGLKVEMAWLRRRLAADAEAMIHIDGAATLLDNGIQASHRIAGALRPMVLDYGLVPAFEWQAREFEKRMDIRCDFRAEPEEIEVQAEVGTALFRVFQETLTNIAKHSGAHSVEARLFQLPLAVELDVSDDGGGFSDTDLAKRNSFGIRGMRERIEELGGAFSIGSVMPRGTKITVRVPLRVDNKDRTAA